MRKKYIIITLIIAVVSNFCSGQVPLLYGTANGGTNNVGVIFKINGDGTGFTTLYNFSSLTGSYPRGHLLQVSNSLFFGTAQWGGINGNGVIYSFDITTNTYTAIHDFNGLDGSLPLDGLIKASNGILYGVTAEGGTNNYGTLFSYDMNLSSYTKLYDFSGPTGMYPYSKLFQANNGLLYGATHSSTGIYHSGSIFSFDVLSNTFTDVFDFNSPLNGNEAYGSLIQAANGKLYGTTQNGSTSGTGNNGGIIYSYDITLDTLAVLQVFNQVKGRYPLGNLTQTTNGNFYGITMIGGMFNNGVLFSVDSSSSNYSVLVDFDSIAKGKQPHYSPILASDGNFYGTTLMGGLTNNGVIFRFDPSSNIFTKILDFNGTNGSGSVGDLLEFILTPTTTHLSTNTQTLTLSPNPAKDILNITLNNPNYLNYPNYLNQPITISVYDIMGKQIFTTHTTTSNLKLQTSNFPAGIYFVKAIGEKINQVARFIKE